MNKMWLLLLCCLHFGLWSQNKSPLFLTLSTKGGILMAHRTDMSHLVQKNAYGFEVSISKQQTEDSYYANKHHFPLNGLSLEYRNFGNDLVLGKAISLLQYQTFPIYQSPNHLSLDFSLGGGIGYITKFYQKDLNPTNNAIGSHLNAKVSFKLALTKYTNRLHFGIGSELSHFSNGAIQTPNLGLNNLSIYLNFGYNFDKHLLYDKSKPFITTDEITKSSFLFEGILTIAEVSPLPLDAKKYPVFAGRFSWVKPINKSWNYEIALDVVHNQSNLHRYYDSTFTLKDVPQVGVYAGMSLNFYQSQIVFGLGYYVVNKINPLGRIYNRIGYRYYFNEQWLGLFNIRAAFGRADFFEFGIGYKL